MLKLKKFLSGMLSAAMLGAVLTMPAAAENYPVTADYWADSWRFEYSSGKDSRETMYMVTTKDYSHSGEASLLMKFPEAKPQGWLNVASSDRYKLEAGVEYTIGCWVKGWVSSQYNGGNFYFGPEWTARKHLGELKPLETTEDGWMHYQFKFTPEKTVENKIWLMGDKLCNSTDLLVDDVYLYAGDSSENLINNGDFEGNVPVYEKMDFLGQDMFFGWSKPVMQDGTPLPEDSSCYVQVSDNAARTGTKSLYVRKPVALQGRDPLMLQQHVSLEPGTYTFTCYIKGKFKGNIWWGFEWDNKALDQMTLTMEKSGWQKCTYTKTLEKKCNYVTFMLYSDAAEGAYIDDVSLVKEGSSENLIANPSFEEAYSYKAGAPVALTAYPATTEGVGVISWKNPYADVTELELTVDGEPVEFDKNLEKSGRNEVVLTGLQQYRSYECTLSVTSDGKTVTETVTLIPDHTPWNNYAGNQAINPWEFIRQEKEGEYANTVLSLDRETKYSGNSAIKIQGTRLSEASNVYASFGQNVTLKKNTSYQFSFMTRYIKARSFFVQGLDTEANGFWSSNPDIMSGNSGWKKVTYNIEAVDGFADDSETYQRNIRFIIPDGADGIWLDDIELYPVVYGSVDKSVNYIKDGGFEYDDWTVESVTYNLMYGDDVVDTIDTLESGRILPRVNIRNTNADNLSVAVVSAVYKDGRLISLGTAEQEIPKLDYALTSTAVGAAVDVPEMEEGSEYELKVMLWDGFGEMKPLWKTTGLK